MTRLIGPTVAATTNRVFPNDIDYRAALTGPGCIGFWRFDTPSSLATSGGKVASINNWKAGGPALNLHVGGGVVGATRVTGDGDRGQLRFAKADKTTYELATPPAMSAAWSLVFHATLRGINGSDFVNLFGDITFPAPWAGLSMVGRSLIFSGAKGAEATAQSLADNAIVSVVASYDGAGNARLDLNGRSFFDGGISGVWAPSAMQFGGIDFPIAGDVDHVAVYSVDLHSAGQAARLAALQEWQAARPLSL